MPSPTAIALLALLPVLQEPGEPRPSFAAFAGLEVPFAQRLGLALSWEELQRREALVRFPPTAAREATVDLENRVQDPARRAAALTALGASKLPGSRALLEAWALQGTGPLERRAAVLALGELGLESLTPLRQIARSDDPLLVESALLAMLRVDAGGLRRELTALASDTTRSAAPIAANLLAFETDPTRRMPESVRLRFELRWEAAMRYGLVDGKSYTKVRIDALWSDPRFVRAVVLRSLPRLQLPGVRDHLLSLVEREQGPEIVRAAVIGIPLTLGRRVAEGTWRPSSLEEWRTALDALEESGSPPKGFEIAKAALELPELRVRAAGIMLAMGDETAPTLVQEVLFEGDPATRVRFARALGRSRDPRWVGELTRLQGEGDPELATAALVAQMRMGYRPADEIVRSTILSGAKEERNPLVAELLQVHHDTRVPPLLEAAMPFLEGSLRLRCAAVLAAGGRVLPRRIVREALERGTAADLAPTLVRALGVAPTHEDLELIARTFPTSSFELDVALCRVLVTRDHALGMSLLERAVWTSGFDESVLAAGLVTAARGIDALVLQLDSPPGPVSEKDLRRVGFALGEWGGVEALELLARRRPSSDPALQGAYLGAMSLRTQ